MNRHELGQYVSSRSQADWFNTLSNKHPLPRGNDPRNEKDYDTFFYGTEPLPGDRTWVRTAAQRAGIRKGRAWEGHDKA